MVKNDVPSFISSETIRPRRRATTPYTLPRTSAGEGQHLLRLARCGSAGRVGLLDAWMSQVYIANLMRGDQSSIPARQESRTDEIRAPITAELFPRPAQSVTDDQSLAFKKRRHTLGILGVLVERDILDDPCHAHDWLGAERSLKSRHLEPGFN